ncbi:ribosome biogenesis GTPase A [Siminovitchia terrae]|uniref:Ribosome biogenesis GTPase A n=1 Tax=Siminovitchia terrae TaxID=1914933 RepID=A0A429XBP8_SIMTE|nr:ribosome biogenesis GTPase YlqF [Siminovitchia terrae]RST60779.1 ribosome biogenesis GTPase YlqF [Siminovitchia terrae]GIN91395.1 ribosome biogenesis GTPase A [Siminovitchia terrae]GIN94669.1 ribosome biogenesis GTPase A [Siminovitchia terrae]
MTIQWFPGHMAKARREVTEKLKLVDIVFELVDARIPVSSANPMLQEIIQQKQRLILLNKSDMADPDVTRQWISRFSEEGNKALAINSQSGRGLNEIIKAAEELLREKRDRRKAKGLKPRAIRAMIIGIPNVGKSTLINRLAKKNIAKTGNTPGVTRGQQWIKVGKDLELLDTPGILWPKFEDQEIGYKLALTGAIKDSLLNMQDIAVFALRFLEAHYPENMKKRYQLKEIPEDIVVLFDHIGKLRGCLTSGGEIDYEKTAETVIMDVRAQKLGNITFDMPDVIID